MITGVCLWLQVWVDSCMFMITGVGDQVYVYDYRCMSMITGICLWLQVWVDRCMFVITGVCL